MAADKVPFLSTKYGAYYNRPVFPLDDELTKVAPGTPCGEYFRRFWLPVAVVEELGTGLPKRVRILGEDLVVFQDGEGRIGLLALHCSHRRTSLEYGIIQQKGIRCCYHGWVYDIDGTILEMPPEPPDSTLKERLCHGAYPVYIHNGFVFAYMGPPDKKPAFPQYDSFTQPGMKYVLADKYILPCNWLQAKDNCMDPAHRVWLHARSSGLQGDSKEGTDAEWNFIETPIGMSYLDTRRVGDYVWVRIADFIPPNVHQFPNPLRQTKAEGNKAEMSKFRARAERIVFTVPVDDTNTMNMAWRRVPENEGYDRKKGAAPMRTYETWLQKSYEERQRTPGDYEAQTSQGSITIHAEEHLASSDRGVIMLRNLIRSGIRAVQKGEDPLGVYPHSVGHIPTFASETYIRIPPEGNWMDDRKLLREIAHRLARQFVYKNIQTREEFDLDSDLKDESL